MKAVRVTENWQLAGVHYVRVETMVKGFEIPLDKEFDEGDLSSPFYVLVLDGIYPAAACRIHLLEGEKAAKIERVSVISQYRGKGVGRLLIEEAEQWIRELGYKKIIITSRDEAVGFYEALGYEADYNKIVDSGIFRIVYTEKILTEQEEQHMLESSTEPKVRPKEIENEIDERGAFIRQPNHFTTPFGHEEGDLKAESGRYRLFWAKGCHWSNRASIVRELLGLEDAIGINLVGHSKENSTYGWEFVYDEDRKDPVLGTQFLSELYYNGDPDYKGRCTVPALVDITSKKVVNNDYHRLTNYLETAFRPFQAPNAPDLYPVELRKEIDAYNDWLFPNINNATYRMMFAQSITAYEEAFEDFYRAMDQIEERLSTNRFLFGDYVTDSDVRLFVTLARFDAHYYRNLGPIKHRVVDYENIWAYCRDLYEIPAFQNNTYFRAFAAPQTENKSFFQDFNSRFVDQIDFKGIWSAPQNRKLLSKTPEEKFKRYEIG